MSGKLSKKRARQEARKERAWEEEKDASNPSVTDPDGNTCTLRQTTAAGYCRVSKPKNDLSEMDEIVTDINGHRCKRRDIMDGEGGGYCYGTSPTRKG